MRRPSHSPRLVGVLLAASGGGCADVIGADFDVHPECETCPVVLADGLDHPKSVAVADGFVFWTESNDPGRVMKVPVGGGDPELVSEGDAFPNQIVAGGGFVYWTNTISGTGAVRRAPTKGGPVDEVTPAQDVPLGLALDATHLYWSEQGTSSIRATALDALPSAGTALATDVVSPSLLALDGNLVYFSSFGETGGLHRVSNTGGDQIELLPALPFANAVALTPEWACVTSFRAGMGEEDVLCIAKSGDGAVKLAGTRDQPTGMIADGERLFWGELGSGAIYTGQPYGSVELVASGQSGPNGITQDETSLYWANFVDDGAIVKMRKP